ncbi:MAG TPA: NmrA family NAD(P)-binding protein [Kofleriaceae bacterium]
MYTVFGASGHTGRIVAERLVAAGKQVRAVTRDAKKAPAGTDAVVGEMTDRAFVVRALADAEGAYLVLPPDVRSRDLIALNRGIAESYAEGLRVNRTAHAVLLSSMGAQNSNIGPATSNHEAEKILRASATPLTILRPPFFMENLGGNIGPMKSDGVLPVFGGDEEVPFPMIATRDIGSIAADALLAPVIKTRTLELNGPADRSYADVAAIASELLGRTVTARALPLEAMAPALVQHAGFSPEVAALFPQMIVARREGRSVYEHPASVVRGSTSLETFLGALLAH